MDTVAVATAACGVDSPAPASEATPEAVGQLSALGVVGGGLVAAVTRVGAISRVVVLGVRAGLTAPPAVLAAAFTREVALEVCLLAPFCSSACAP